jgi:hypothetical protein
MSIVIPDEILQSTRLTAAELMRELIAALARFKVSAWQYTAEELATELADDSSGARRRRIW